MSDLKKKIKDILLFPQGFYEKLSDNRLLLYFGVIIIGAVDIFLPDFILTYKNLFEGKANADLTLNIIIAVLAVITIGFIDVLFLAFPLYDLFKYFKKKEGQPHNASLTKVAKVYIVSHFWIVPVNIALYYLVGRNINENSGALLINLWLAVYFIVIIWQASIISRGINTLFNFNPLLKRLTFIVVFTWYFLLGMVLSMQIVSRVMALFR